MSKIFSAQELETEMEWSDLVLPPKVIDQIENIKNWVLHQNTMIEEWGMKRSFKSGYKALFYGPPGTGKTLTASLLGKYTQKPVYKVDLSIVVSKFIGETEKKS